MSKRLERVVAVDWSGDRSAAGQRRKIWAGVWTAGAARAKDAGEAGQLGGTVRLESGRTRAELAEWLVELAQETPRMVVGIDCCFSFPAWFVAEHGCGTVWEFWRAVVGDSSASLAATSQSSTSQSSTGLAGKGEEWLHRGCADGRFWGVVGPARTGKRPAEFTGVGLRQMMRTTDWENKIAVRLEGGDSATYDEQRAALMRGITAKSPFQIGGSGSVGTGSLRAMPVLERLREAGFRVWPFESAALGGRRPQPLVVEMYTRLLTGPVAKSNEGARRAYLVAKRKTDAAYAGLGRGVVAKAVGSEDGFDALVCCVEMAKRRGEFAGLRATGDPLLAIEGITWRPGVS